MIDPKQIKEYSDSVASGSKVLAGSWRSFLIASALVSWGSLLLIILLVVWQGRDAIAKQLYLKVGTHSDQTTPILDPWPLVPIEEFPEFWVCETKQCVADESKRKAVNQVLLQLKNELEAVRVVYSVYGFSYRRVAAQSTALGEQPLGPELWITPLSQPGIGENIKLHEKGLCSSVQVSKLPEGSLLRVGAPVYNVQFVKSCPTDTNDLAYYLQGYISADFSAEPVTELPEVEHRLRKAAEKIEGIMGYDEQAAP